MNKTYTPNPIDTSAISLPEDILELGEMLAKNTHENFVKMRITSGWSYYRLCVCASGSFN